MYSFLLSTLYLHPFVVFRVLGQASHFQVTLTTLNGLIPFIDNLFFTFIHALSNDLNKGNCIQQVLVDFWDGNNCLCLCKVESNFWVALCCGFLNICLDSNFLQRTNNNVIFLEQTARTVLLFHTHFANTQVLWCSTKQTFSRLENCNLESARSLNGAKVLQVIFYPFIFEKFSSYFSKHVM